MPQGTGNLLDAARQVLETDLAFAGEFVPARRSELPEIAPAAQDAAADVPDTMTPQQKADALAALEQEAGSCHACQLAQTRNKLVFGEGKANADLVFVGEAPGADEDASGRPFVGKAGQLLTNMVHAMGLTREDVYICNMLKCRPPGNRNPNPQEIECCWGLLVRQLEIIRPKVIVTLGNPATMGLLDTKVGITRMRGQWQKLPPIGEGLGGTDVMPTFHPAYVVRQYNQDTRGKVWSDLQKVMARLGLKLPTKPGPKDTP
jgi:DNA polymerase